jgi:hypothetical protein
MTFFRSLLGDPHFTAKEISPEAKKLLTPSMMACQKIHDP